MTALERKRADFASQKNPSEVVVRLIINAPIQSGDVVNEGRGITVHARILAPAGHRRVAPTWNKELAPNAKIGLVEGLLGKLLNLRSPRLEET